jgi:hypothetical protein
VYIERNAPFRARAGFCEENDDQSPAFQFILIYARWISVATMSMISGSDGTSLTAITSNRLLLPGGDAVDSVSYHIISHIKYLFQTLFPLSFGGKGGSLKGPGGVRVRFNIKSKMSWQS